MTPTLAAAPVEFERRVHKALKFWHDSHPNDGLLDDLLIAHRAAPAQPMTRRQRTNLLLRRGLSDLSGLNPQDAELLALRFCEQLPMSETRRHLNYAESTIYSKQNQAITRLAAILYGLELTAWHERAALLAGRLDPPPALLVGIDSQIDGLASLLAAPTGPRILAIEGIGGIGKTTLAAAVMRKLSADTTYEEFAWISAQVVGLDLCGDVYPRPQPVLTAETVVAALAQQLLPSHTMSNTATMHNVLASLRQRLKTTPHLVTVDNLETVLDPQVLLRVLHTLAGPTKFIITTRRRLIAESNVFLHDVPELRETDALTLLRYAAREHSLPALAACPDSELLPIYRAIGGNPLALLLVLGQAHLRPLHAIVAGLGGLASAAGSLGSMETLFGYIYRQAWDGLCESDRCVLLQVAAAETGRLDAETIEAICRSACDCSQEVTAAALRRLIQANLVYTVSDLDNCHYRLHSLTRTFLQQIAPRWL
jgi:hypothetical protein